MTKEQTEIFIKDFLLEWCPKFGISVPEKIKCRTHDFYCMSVPNNMNYLYGKSWHLVYYWSNIKKHGCNTKASIIAFLLHEIGHIYHRASYETVGKVEAEYLAQTFAIKKMKKHYPKEFKKMEWNLYEDVERKHLYYNTAFKRIKEYKEEDK